MMTASTADKQRLITLEDNVINSAALFSTGREITIIHNSEAYKLRLTGNGKLILTK